jgi:H+-transporting ATPase
MDLMVSVAGHRTIVLTRGRFWSTRRGPNPVDGRPGYPGHRDADRGVRAVHDTARLGLGVVRLGYALVWALLGDRVKLLAYRILDPVTTQQDQTLQP